MTAQTDKACFCCTLRSAGQMIGYLNIILSVLTLIVGLMPPMRVIQIVTSIISILAGVALVYGIHKEKPQLLVPDMFLTIISLFALILFAIYIPFVIFVLMKSETARRSVKFNDKNDLNRVVRVATPLVASGMSIYLWILTLIMIVIFAYLLRIKYLLYKAIAHDGRTVEIAA